MTCMHPPHDLYVIIPHIQLALAAGGQNLYLVLNGAT